MSLHRHHRKRRSQGGTDDPWNIMLVSPQRHDEIHRNPEDAYKKGWLVYSWMDPKERHCNDYKLTAEGYAIKNSVELCPKCKGWGKVTDNAKTDKPEKPKEAKPKGVYSFRIPKDALENGHEVVTSLIDSARDHLAPLMGWSETVSPYYVIVAVLHDWHGQNT